MASHSFSLLLSSTKHKSIAPAGHGHSRSLCSIMLMEVALIILNWTRSIESKVDTAIIFFRKMRGIYVYRAFAPTTGIRNSQKRKISPAGFRIHRKYRWIPESIRTETRPWQVFFMYGEEPTAQTQRNPTPNFFLLAPSRGRSC